MRPDQSGKARKGSLMSPENEVKEPNEEEQGKSSLREWLDFFVYLIIVAGCCLLFIKFVAVRSVVIGHSMNPLLHDQDNLIVEKVSYYFRDPERFDIIVFKVSEDSKEHFIKRIIGLPGETVQIKDGCVYINGELLTDDVYGRDPIDEAYTAARPVTLGEDEYFVMGDNRNNSKDSRSVEVGPVHRSQFLGRAWFRFWPFKSAGIVSHRN